MSKLDEMSQTIGRIEANVATLGREMGEVKRKVEAIDRDRYQAQGALWMVRFLWGVGAACTGALGGFLARKSGI
jgi:hypothetical protein